MTYCCHSSRNVRQNSAATSAPSPSSPPISPTALGIPKAEAQIVRHAVVLHDHRQDGHPRRNPREARSADGRGVGPHAAAHRHRGPNTVRGARFTSRRGDRPGFARTLGRRRLPRRNRRSRQPLGAQIIFACDAYDAMTADRAYSRRRSSEAALSEFERCAGTQFDPAVVAALVAHVRE